MEQTVPKKKTTWLKKLGVAGFLFFLIKGLVWIGIAVWAWLGLSS
jgi:hypothetical protein